MKNIARYIARQLTISFLLSGGCVLLSALSGENDLEELFVFFLFAFFGILCIADAMLHYE